MNSEHREEFKDRENNEEYDPVVHAVRIHHDACQVLMTVTNDLIELAHAFNCTGNERVSERLVVLARLIQRSQEQVDRSWGVLFETHIREIDKNHLLFIQSILKTLTPSKS